MGVITASQEQHNFNGLITIKWLSRQELQRGTHCFRFHIDHYVNQLIVDGDWHQLHDDPSYTMDELTQLIVNYYQLEEDVEATLCYRYATHVGKQRTRELREVLGHETIENKTFIDKHGQRQQLTIQDVVISCFLTQGTLVERKVNCNSAFMLANLPPIATEIRQRLHWVPPDEPIYLVMDNAGGHGTQEAREEYTGRLLEEFNIVIIQQSARSPEVNALDLGIWMSIQSHVENRHRDRCRDPDSLAATVREAWENLTRETIQRVFDRIPIVLELIVGSGGDNVTVEDQRGRHNMAFPDPE